MNIKNIVIWVIVLLVVVIGGYFIYKSMSSQSAAQQSPNAATGQQAVDTQATSTATSTQVQAQEVAVGTGAVAQPGDSVSVLYVGQLQDGTVFDSSAAHGNQPLIFTLGAQGLIPGFQIGVNGMKVGGERLLSIPPSLGYGAQDVKDSTGKVIIPANSTIIFDVKLVKVAASTSTSATAPTTPAK
jgi:FKBP-type peptidyl-prolyl cis-trans isomerase